MSLALNRKFHSSVIAYRHWLSVVVLALASGVAPQTIAQSIDNAWYAGTSFGVVTTDDSFRHDGNIYSVVLGRAFKDRYALEIELFQDTLNFGINYGLKHQGFSVNHRTINREPLWNPYFLIGVGMIRFDSPFGEKNGSDAMVNVGIGGEWELLVPNRVLLRADLRLRYDFNDSLQPGQEGFGDGILSVGLIVPFAPNR